ncbi:hypothetical protein SERLADRAFT_412081 [Serpula lacrymans var. lacrymans S7.9]|uniref:Uncharacterized protein n=1 Tax=Serpula lacrymans var. lacrymans (strain S7.9) TaxID=578457 RepID=F8PDR9_SERL9|nr:uncharacterized protein SERLADRAFT_412081 [Serpula lacrymans var. lacrymans S7.9]EGO18889.1 hypothetical protein SERLADRAFT_412081 [Serpula lacrymans var. lacrymans S7.9]
MSMLLGSDFTLATTDKLAEAIQVEAKRQAKRFSKALEKLYKDNVVPEEHEYRGGVSFIEYTEKLRSLLEEATASNCVQCNEGIWVINAISESLRWAERSQEDRMPVPLQEDIPANAIEEDSEEHSEEDQLRQAWEVLNEHKLDHYVFSENRAAELEYDRWTILQFRTEAVLMYYGLMDREK